MHTPSSGVHGVCCHRRAWSGYPRLWLNAGAVDGVSARLVHLAGAARIVERCWPCRRGERGLARLYPNACRPRGRFLSTDRAEGFSAQRLASIKEASVIEQLAVQRLDYPRDLPSGREAASRHGRGSAQEGRKPDPAHVSRLPGVQRLDGSVAARPCAAPGLRHA